MQPDREIDARIAREVFGHKVWTRGEGPLETSVSGEHPLRNYSTEIQWAWLVAEKVKVSLLAVEGGQWFAFVGPEEIQGWPAPETMLRLLEAKQFEGCGAAVGDNAPFVICQAALKAMEKRHRPNLQVVEDRPDVH